MIRLRCRDVVLLQVGIGFEDLLGGATGCEQPEDGAYGDPHPSDARLAAHDVRVQGDAVENWHRHSPSDKRVYQPTSRSLGVVTDTHPQSRVLLLTGTCGSGKTTVAALLAERQGWVHVSEDEIWQRLFGKDRGAFGSEEHRRKRREVHAVAFARIREALAAGADVVVDATVHETPPEALYEYREWFAAHGVAWTIRVLHPRLEVAVARDAHRRAWTVGAQRVAALRAKFSGGEIGRECFLDTSGETPEETMTRLLAAW